MAKPTVGLSADDRRRWGRSVRKIVPRSIHAFRLPRPAQADPLTTIAAQNRDRLATLVPERNARMAQSALAFFLGSPRIMADDLAGTLSSGLAVQMCGDASLTNFGLFDAADRSLVFDINDYAETRLGPWEWDVKRLATSFAVAARHRSFAAAEVRAVAQRAVAAYRKAMHRLDQMSYLDAWHARVAPDGVCSIVDGGGPRNRHVEGRSTSRSPRSLIADRNGVPGFLRGHPDVVPLASGDRPSPLAEEVEDIFVRYRRNLAPSRSVLLERYEAIAAAATATGISGVGIPTFALLLAGRDERDRVLLELRRASDSALETAGADGPGPRVVTGQRVMQAVEDPFLGWSHGRSGDHYVVRRMPETRAVWDVDRGSRKRLRRYAKLCGRALARAHARSGDVPAIAGYLGTGDGFDRAIVDFADSYADQNERDYDGFRGAISSGRFAIEE